MNCKDSGTCLFSGSAESVSSERDFSLGEKLPRCLLHAGEFDKYFVSG